ncbi:Sulfhydryl oxidase [Paramicrosporidium saccamoebae]|uniref:Sulfhydryl oxidase n=1 Tax=Paramicrosporidium saccamoebae TaxID=1246581 RepID=A0A2H9THI2_9FUNG|nr:Sulfhydryl oxidase [Paramicrosporidium saccamoebae]
MDCSDNSAVFAERRCLCKAKDRRRKCHLDRTHPLAVASISYSLESTSEVENDVGPKDEEEFRKLLGNATWRLLHTLAARYPDEPTDVDKTRMDQFMGLISHLYPCPKCARHMRQMLIDNPPKAEFSQYVCTIHNIVNKRLGKPEFSCEDVDAHYDCGCDLLDDDEDDEKAEGTTGGQSPVKPVSRSC